jgi:hypothetical protein
MRAMDQGKWVCCGLMVALTLSVQAAAQPVEQSRQKSRPQCCRAEYAACINYCADNPQRGSCSEECNTRLISCRYEGVFEQPSKTVTRC